MHCKSYSHFFSKKFQHICVSLDVNFNESLTNDIVSFEQLGPGRTSLFVSFVVCLLNYLSMKTCGLPFLLTFSILWANSADNKLIIFSYFWIPSISKKTINILFTLKSPNHSMLICMQINRSDSNSLLTNNRSVF